VPAVGFRHDQQLDGQPVVQPMSVKPADDVVLVRLAQQQGKLPEWRLQDDRWR